MDKLVSIIIPVYNRETIVGETLDSILGQSYIMWECILVDDGSSDGTLNVLHHYQNMDKRFKVLQRPNTKAKGAPSCRNYGVEQAKGEFVQFFDSDDLMLPNMLQEKVQYLEVHPEACFVVSRMGEFNEEGERPAPDYAINSQNITMDFLRYKVYFLTPGPLFRRSLLEKFKVRFDVELKKNQEREFYSRIMLDKPPFGVIDKIHCLRRIHNNTIASLHSKSGVHHKLITKYDFFSRLKKNTGGRYDEILFRAYSKDIFMLVVHFVRYIELKYSLKSVALLLSLCFSSRKKSTDISAK